MADYFLDVPIETDEQTLADDAVARLQETWEDWEPNEGDLEVVLIEALAQMAADAAQVAAVMPATAFETLLVDLYGVVRDEGTPATGSVTFTLMDTDPHTIPEGTEVLIDGWVFLTDDEQTTNALTKAGVAVTADEVGTDANGLVGDQVSMMSAFAFIASVTLDAPTSGATTPETDEQYRTKGSQQLELQARTLVTARDYTLMALAEAGVERAVTVANTAARTVVVTASGPDGAVLGSQLKTDLLALFNEYRQTTWTVSIADATKTTITVTYTIHVYPGFSAVGVIAEVNQILARFLDPNSWGAPQYAPANVTEWIVETRVRKNKVIDMIGNAHGVDYVNSVTLSGSAGSVDAPTGDWIMPGTTPLPVSNPAGHNGSAV